jgi:hypothetical protein
MQVPDLIFELCGHCYFSPGTGPSLQLLLVVVKTSQSLVNAIRSLVLPTYLAIVQYWYMWEHDYDKRDSS